MKSYDKLRAKASAIELMFPGHDPAMLENYPRWPRTSSVWLRIKAERAEKIQIEDFLILVPQREGWQNPKKRLLPQFVGFLLGLLVPGDVPLAEAEAITGPMKFSRVNRQVVRKE